jgi:hypothetical protein
MEIFDFYALHFPENLYLLMCLYAVSIVIW